MIKKDSFTNLHLHSQFSALDGMIRIPELISHVKELGQTTCALTDHGTCSGFQELYNECRKNEIKPIFGMEAYITTDRTDKSRRDKERNTNKHLILLAKNKEGFKNLFRLHYEGYATGSVFVYDRAVPRIDRTLLDKWHSGLICMSACIAGEIQNLLLDENEEGAVKVVEYYKDLFKDDFYLEIQPYSVFNNEQETIQRLSNDRMLEFSKLVNVPVVITTDAHYLLKDDRDFHQLLLAIQSKKPIDDDTRLTFECIPIMSSEEMAEQYGEDVVKLSSEIADKCDNLTLESEGYHIPTFHVHRSTGFEEWLRKTNGKYEDVDEQELFFRYGIQKGWDNLIRPKFEDDKEKLSEYKERLQMEINVIKGMGFIPYFLIVADVINYCRENKILTGAARGSAGGVLCSYLLGITREIDPIKYGLLFERFLNPDRIAMPDIDNDIQDNRRNEVKEYLIQKYGEGKVASIATFGRLKVRACVKDVIRSLNAGGDKSESFRLANTITGMLGSEPDITLDEALSQFKDFREEANKQIRIGNKSYTLETILRKFEGLVRQTGIHAAGVIISDEPLNEVIPMMADKSGDVATAYDGVTLESLGYLKLDLLGLRTLTVISDALENIKRVRDEDVEFIYEGLPLDINGMFDKTKLPSDKDSDEYKNLIKATRAYKLLQDGKTKAIFQLGGSGMAALLKSTRANNIEDISAVLALHRPGPLGAGLTTEYGERKFGKRAITYLHPSLESVLKNTFGVLTYQEQIMQIAVQCAGFTGAESDTLRKGVGKKKKDIIDKMQPKFIEGCQEVGGMSKEKAEELWKQIEYFSSYGFNKSHSVAYAYNAYLTAFLKANYPTEFWGAVLSNEPRQNQENIVEYIKEIENDGRKAKRAGKRIVTNLLPVHVNKSGLNYIVEDKYTIRRDLTSLKGLGEKSVDKIVEMRKVEHGGAIKSMIDFLDRCAIFKVNKNGIEALIKAGAFDDAFDINYPRRVYFDRYDDCRTKLKRHKKRHGNIDKFEYDWNECICTQESECTCLGEWSFDTLLNYEKDIYGMAVSGNFLYRYDKLAMFLENKCKDKYYELGIALDDYPVNVTLYSLAFLQRHLAKLPYKKHPGKFVWKFLFQGFGGTMTVGMFHDQFVKYKNLLLDNNKWREGQVYYIKSHIDTYQNQKELKFDELMFVDDFIAKLKSKGVNK